MAAEKLRHPEELELPPEETIEALVQALPEESAKKFLRELIHSVEEAKRTGNLLHINRVVEGWSRTVLFMTDAGFAERWEGAPHPGPESVHDLDEARRRLGL